MLLIPRTTRGYYRDRNVFRYHLSQLNIITIFCTITVHARYKNFTCTKFIGFHGPFNGIHTHIHSSAIFIYIPTTLIWSSLSIYCNYNALTSKFICCFRYKIWIKYCSGVNSNFICPFS